MIDYLDIIGSVGFPIVAFLLMYRLNEKTIKENTAAIKALTEFMKVRGK
tara:strand:+ start:592 stop:738 length:147 start_codon:yes stop_codon:yes gene_type:complete